MWESGACDSQLCLDNTLCSTTADDHFPHVLSLLQVPGMIRATVIVAVSAIACANGALETLPSLHGAQFVQTSSSLGHIAAMSTVRATGDPPCPIIAPTPDLPAKLPPAIIEAIAAFNTAANAAANGSSVNGLSVALAYKGAVLSTVTSGLANRSAGTSVSPTSLFRIGSATKIFTTVLANLLASQGRLQLDEPVNVLAAEFQPLNLFDDANITWRDLLEQRSGLQREAPFGLTETDEVLHAVSETLLINRPGGPPSYSNLGFAIVGNVLAEKVLSTDFASAVDSLIVKPLGLEHTGTTYDQQVLSDLAVGYSPSGLPYAFYNLGWSGPAGAMYSTPSDLNVLAWALMQAAKGVGPLAATLDATTAQVLLDPTYRNPDGLTVFGAPWEMRVHGSYLVRRKGGNLPGYATLMSFVPELDLAVSGAWTFASSEFDNSVALWDALLGNFTEGLQGLAPSPVDPGPTPGDYTGVYMSQDGSLKLEVAFNVTGRGELIFVVPGVLSVFIHDAAWTHKQDLFQVYIPPGTLPCLDGELLGFQNQFVQFGRNTAGSVVNASALGIIPAVVFFR